MNQKDNPLGVGLVPYCEVDGIRTFADSEILGLYDRMVRSGTADVVFRDGKINCREDWLRAMKSPENFLYVAYEAKDVVALAWLNRVEMKKAQAHYCVFYKGWRKGSVKICKQILKILMEKKTPDGEYLFDVLTGITPVANKVAIKFMQRCGWKVIGTLPHGTWNHKTHRSEPAIVSYYTREACNENL